MRDGARAALFRVCDDERAAVETRRPATRLRACLRRSRLRETQVENRILAPVFVIVVPPLRRVDDEPFGDQSVTVTADTRERVGRAAERLIAAAAANGDSLTREGALTLLAEFDDVAAAMLAELS